MNLDQAQFSLVSIFLPLPAESVADWAHREILLPPGEGANGLEHPDWRLMPDMPEILEAARNPDTREIILAFAAQSGKTIGIVCMIGWLMRHTPGNTLWMLPDDKLVDQFGRERLRPIYEQSNVGLSPRRDAKRKNVLRFETCRLIFAIASKSSSLSSTPCKYVVADEEDENPSFASGAASPEKLARERQRTFPHNSLFIRACTPRRTDRGVYPAYESSRAHKLYVTCPRCKKEITLKMGDQDTEYGIKWAKDDAGNSPEPEKVKSGHLAWYQCQECGGRIEDHDRPAMLETMRWKCERPDRPTTRMGFHKSVLYSPFVDWSMIAAEFLDSKDDIAKLQNFNHSWLAEPKDVTKKEIREDDLKAQLYQPYLRGEVPQDVIAITAGADTGDSDVHVTYVGWGEGGEHWKLYSAQYKGPNFDAALSRFESEWRRNFQFNGASVPISGGAMDAGGHNPEAVYKFCKRNPQWIPSHGHGRISAPWLISLVMVGKKGRQRPIWVNLYTYWDRYFQDIMQAYLTKGRGEGPGFAHVPENCSAVWLKHLTNEVLRVAPDRQGHMEEKYVPRYSGAPIHYRDSYKLAILRAYTMRLQRLAVRERSKEEPAPQSPLRPPRRLQRPGKYQPLSNRI